MDGCITAGCPRPLHARGWCNTCYRRWLYHTPPAERPAVSPKGTCGVWLCETAARWRGLCTRHYSQWRRVSASTDQRDRDRQAVREWNARNPDRRRQANQAWRAENRERRNEMERLARDRRRDELNFRRRQRYAANSAARAEANKLWARTNREAVVARAQRRIARKRAAEGDVTLAQWREILLNHDSKCFYCGTATPDLQMEHKTPLSRGGAHSPGNVVPACKQCNLRKGTLTAEEFAERRAWELAVTSSEATP